MNFVNNASTADMPTLADFQRAMDEMVRQNNAFLEREAEVMQKVCCPICEHKPAARGDTPATRRYLVCRHLLRDLQAICAQIKKTDSVIKDEKFVVGTSLWLDTFPLRLVPIKDDKKEQA